MRDWSPGVTAGEYIRGPTVCGWEVTIVVSLGPDSGQRYMCAAGRLHTCKLAVIMDGSAPGTSLAWPMEGSIPGPQVPSMATLKGPVKVLLAGYSGRAQWQSGIPRYMYSGEILHAARLGPLAHGCLQVCTFRRLG